MLARASIVKKKMPLTSCTGKHRLLNMGRRKNPHAVALARRGAKKGGHARAASLTPEQRKEVARKAAEARWAKGGRKEGGSRGKE